MIARLTVLYWRLCHTWCEWFGHRQPLLQVLGHKVCTRCDYAVWEDR